MFEGKKTQGGRRLFDGWGDSLGEWARDFIDVAVTLAVILVILRVALGSKMLVPLVVVTSGSMVHHEGDNSWIAWLNDRGVVNDTIGEMPFGGGFNQGDMIVTMRPEVKLGDVIIYERDFLWGSPALEPIIHRVVGVVHVNGSRVVGVEGTLDCLDVAGFDAYIRYVEDCRSGRTCYYPRVPESGSYSFYLTKGDANTASDQCSTPVRISLPVNEAQIPARGWLRLPYVGWIKLFLNYLLRLPAELLRLLVLGY